MNEYPIFESPWQTPGMWLKANLHTHSTRSDGDAPPEELLQLYAEAEYDVLVLSDHGVAAIPEVRRYGRLLHIPGVEFDTWTESPHPRTGWHIVGFPLTDVLEEYTSKTPQEIIDFIRERDAIPIIAHPYWLGLTHDELRSVNGYGIIEVWNAVCDRDNGKPDSSVIWDDLLYRGLRVGAVAVDDCHEASLDIAKGWTWIRAVECEPGAILDALRRGRYYASCGPRIDDLRVENRIVRVRCSPARRVVFAGSAWTGGTVTAPAGQTITGAELPWPDEAAYLRIVVEDIHGMRAWANPIFQTRGEVSDPHTEDS